MSETTTTKVTFNIPTQELEALKALASRHGITVTSALRRAIGTEVFLEENEQKGSKVLLQEPTGSMSLVIRR